MKSSAEENRSLLKTASDSQRIISVPGLHLVDHCRHPRPTVAPLDWRLWNLLFNGGAPEITQGKGGNFASIPLASKS